MSVFGVYIVYSFCQNDIILGFFFKRLDIPPPPTLRTKKFHTVEFALNTPLVKGRFGEVVFSLFQNPLTTVDFSKTP